MRAPPLPLLLGAIALLAAWPALAEEVTLYLMEVPPMTMNEAQRKGIVGDITLEALRRAGYQPNLIVEPSNRAMISATSAQDSLIIPLARLPDREAHYTWIAPLIKVNRAFFAFGTPAKSFAEAREKYKRIVVSRGSAGVSILLDNGFTREQIIEVTQGETAPKMLLAQRVDAWFNPITESQLLLRQHDAAGLLRMGEPLGPSYNYLACSKSCKPALVERLRGSIEAMEADGSIRAIRQRYSAE